jgi:hypothetical protein
VLGSEVESEEVAILHVFRNSFSGTHFRQRLSKPQGLVRPEGFGKFKKSPHKNNNVSGE